MKSIGVLTLLFLLSSCGTLYNRKQHVLIDSRPRGAKVLDPRGRYLGTTPFVFYGKKSRRNYFSFGQKVGAGDREFAYEVFDQKCSLAFDKSIIPNSIYSLLFFPVGVLLTGASIGVDYFSGGLYSCPPVLDVHLSLEKEDIVRDGVPKRKILPLPLSLGDREIEAIVFKRWKEEQFDQYKKSGDQLIPFYEAQEKLIFYGIGGKAEWTPEKIKSQHLRKLAYETGATHLLYFHKRQKDKDIIITPRLFDIFNQEIVETKFQERFDFPASQLDESFLWKFIKNTVSLFPNSLTFTPPIEREISYSEANGQEIKLPGKRHPGALPTLVSSFGIEDIDYPPLFGTWDYRFKFAPAVGISAWQVNTLGQGFDYELQLQNFSALMQASLTLHTPLGALFVGHGFGPAYTSAADNTSTKFSKWHIIRRTSIMYYTFLSERYFLEIGANIYQINNGVVSRPGFELREWRESYVAIGHYFPELKARIDRFLFD